MKILVLFAFGGIYIHGPRGSVRPSGLRGGNGLATTVECRAGLGPVLAIITTITISPEQLLALLKVKERALTVCRSHIGLKRSAQGQGR